MADTNIHLLPTTGAITAVNFNSDISIPVDVLVSPGTYVTKKIPGDILKTTLTSHITSLSTASFTNINASINNLGPNYFNNTVFNGTGYLTKGSVVPNMFFETEITNHISTSFIWTFKVKLAIIDRVNSTTINNIHKIEKLYTFFKQPGVNPYLLGSVVVIEENSSNVPNLPNLNAIISTSFVQFNFPRNTTWDRQYSYTIEINKHVFTS